MRDFPETHTEKANEAWSSIVHICKLVFSVFITALSFSISPTNLSWEIGNLSNKGMCPLFYTSSVCTLPFFFFF